MYVTPEQITAANKSNVEAALSIAAAQFAAMEKLAGLQTATLKSLFEDSIANARALAGAKDVQEFVTLQQAFAQPAVEKAVSFSKSVYAITVEANTELSKFAEAKASELNQNFVSLLDKASKNAPAGSDVGVAAVKWAYRRVVEVEEPEEPARAAIEDAEAAAWPAFERAAAASAAAVAKELLRAECRREIARRLEERRAAPVAAVDDGEPGDDALLPPLPPSFSSSPEP